MKKRVITQFIYGTIILVMACLLVYSITVHACGMPTEGALDTVEGGEEVRKNHPIPAEEWNEEVRMWLARSVLGEAGWNRFEEQAAIAWVYATRRKSAKRSSFLSIVKRYSAAIRHTGKRRNPWLFELSNEFIRPKSWPQGPLWEGLHEKSWRKTLDLVDRWFAGEVPNVCPGANHYGCYLDAVRADSRGWYVVQCTTRVRNRFYDSRRKRVGSSWAEERYRRLKR